MIDDIDATLKFFGQKSGRNIPLKLLSIYINGVQPDVKARLFKRTIVQHRKLEKPEHEL